MELSTLQLCKSILNTQILNVGADDFQEMAPIVLTAMADLDEAIREALNPIQGPHVVEAAPKP
jgi:hypothetical protein